jgi:hypothetical protein
MLVDRESACSKAQVLNLDVHGISALIPVQRQSVNSSRPECLPMMGPVTDHPTEIEARDLEPRAIHD